MENPGAPNPYRLSTAFAKCTSVRILAKLIELIINRRLRVAGIYDTAEPPIWAALNGKINPESGGKVVPEFYQVDGRINAQVCLDNPRRQPVLDNPDVCKEAYLQAYRTALRLYAEDHAPSEPRIKSDDPARGLVEIEAWCTENMREQPVEWKPPAGYLNAKQILKAEQPPAKAIPPVPQQLSETVAGTIVGMTWQEASNKAEAFVDKSGFPGRTALSRQIGCDTRTLGKAIDNSETLKAAEAIYNESKAPKPKAVSLSDKCLVRGESKAVEPSDEAAVNEILDRVSRPAMIDKIQEWTGIVNPPNDGGSRCTGELPAQLDSCDDRALATIYLTVKQQVDEINTDNPETPGRRKVL